MERDFPGVTIGPEEKKLGIQGSSTTSVILEGARVPVENVLGEIGKGHKIAFNVLNVGRFKLGAAVLGAAKHALGTGAAYANQRKQFGLAISTFGAIQEKLADGVADLFASESLVYRLAGLIDDRLATIPKDAPHYYESYQGAIEEYSIECAISKVFCSEVLADVVDEVVQIHGGYGFVQEYPAEKYYRDERINRIFEGTNEINRLLIPGTLLRRAMKGEIPLEREARKAFESLLSPSLDEIDPSVPFAAEKATIANLKKVFLVISGAAVKRFGAGLKDEQEVLLAAADVAIQAFAIESAVLRAERIRSEALRDAPGTGRGGGEGAHLPGSREAGHGGEAGGLLRGRGGRAGDAARRRPPVHEVRRERAPRCQAAARRGDHRPGAVPVLISVRRAARRRARQRRRGPGRCGHGGLPAAAGFRGSLPGADGGGAVAGTTGARVSTGGGARSDAFSSWAVRWSGSIARRLSMAARAPSRFPRARRTRASERRGGWMPEWEVANAASSGSAAAGDRPRRSPDTSAKSIQASTSSPRRASRATASSSAVLPPRPR